MDCYYNEKSQEILDALDTINELKEERKRYGQPVEIVRESRDMDFWGHGRVSEDILVGDGL
jgi:hypothetical protein